MQQNSDNTKYFQVETFIVDDGRKLGKGVRDEDGYFTDVPVAVLGAVTRNKTSYDTPAFLKQLQGPDSSFYKRLTEGCLFGEYGHPFCDLNSPMGMQRLLNLEAKKESHHIRSVKVKHIDDLNLDLVLMDTKGTGPYGKYHDEAMLDPSRNIAYSLRGISSASVDRRTGVTHKKLVSLVTFDAGVPSGGFKEASKRYMASTEDLNFGCIEIINKPIGHNDMKIVHNIALETFTDSEMNDLMESTRVIIGQKVSYIDTKDKTVVDAETNTSRGLFHALFNCRR